MPFVVRPSVSQVAASKDDSVILASSALIFDKDEKVWGLEVFQFSDVVGGDSQIIKMFINSGGKLVIKFEDNT